MGLSNPESNNNPVFKCALQLMQDSISLAANKLTRTAPVFMGINMKFRRDEMRFFMKKSKCLPENIHQFYDSSDDEECRRDTLKDLHETTNIPTTLDTRSTSLLTRRCRRKRTTMTAPYPASDAST